LGIVPTGPETGYGYIETTQTKIGPAFKVQRFKEKPDLATAKKYVAAGNYYWNGGMFMFSMGAMQKELAKYAPKITADYLQGL
jgi:mannose-1-phosphate guanylyltransferase/mannose-6-phosphate isomerase